MTYDVKKIHLKKGENYKAIFNDHQLGQIKSHILVGNCVKNKKDEDNSPKIE